MVHAPELVMRYPNREILDLVRRVSELWVRGTSQDILCQHYRTLLFARLQRHQQHPNLPSNSKGGGTRLAASFSFRFQGEWAQSMRKQGARGASGYRHQHSLWGWGLGAFCRETERWWRGTHRVS